jgi:tetratricopeptide (TPR) repeat protein
MMLLLIYGLWQAVPDRRAVDALAQGKRSLKRGEYQATVRDLNAVLELVPNSAEARQGLACAYYLTGKRSVAILELTKGLEAGVFAERLGSCGHGLRLDDVFFAAKLGLSDAFAVPRVAGAQEFEEELTDEPSGTTLEEPGRMLLGACLALREHLLGAAWEYAGSALETGNVDRGDRATFFACLDPAARRRAGCARRPSIGTCVMTSAARRAYFNNIRLVDAAFWHESP